jgi:hypothetical protein
MHPAFDLGNFVSFRFKSTVLPEQSKECLANAAKSPKLSTEYSQNINQSIFYSLFLPACSVAANQPQKQRQQ